MQYDPDEDVQEDFGDNQTVTETDEEYIRIQLEAHDKG